MTNQTKIICIGCPKGCLVTVQHEAGGIIAITGHRCKSGLEYAENEFTEPKRIFTSTVKLKNGQIAVLPVKTREPVPKEKLFEIAKATCDLQAEAPVYIGDIICADVCGTGVDLIAVRNAAEK